MLVLIKGGEALVQIDQVSSDCKRQKQKLEVKEGVQKKLGRRGRAREVKSDVRTAVIGRAASKNKGRLLKKAQASGKSCQISPLREAGEGRLKEEKMMSIEKICKEVLQPGNRIKKAMWREKSKFTGREAKLADGLLKMTLSKQLTVTMQEEKMGKVWGVVEELGGFRNMEEEVSVGQVNMGGGGKKMGGEAVKMGGEEVTKGGKEGNDPRARGSIAAAAAAVEKNQRNIWNWKLREWVEGWIGKVEGEATRRCLRVETDSVQEMPTFAPGGTQPAQCGGTSGSKVGQR